MVSDVNFKYCRLFFVSLTVEKVSVLEGRNLFT